MIGIDIDTGLTQAINGWAGVNPVLDQFMVLVTSYGVHAMVLAVILLWWRRSERRATRNGCIVAGLSFLLGLGFNQLILLLVHRVRPYDAGVSHLIIAQSQDWSFPSDHATAVAAMVSAFWLRKLRGIALALLCAALVICLSRVFVGIHYISDVAGGVLTGVAAALLVVSLYRDDSWYARRLVALF